MVGDTPGQSHSWLQGKFKASLGYMSRHLRNRGLTCEIQRQIFSSILATVWYISRNRISLIQNMGKRDENLAQK